MHLSRRGPGGPRTPWAVCLWLIVLHGCSSQDAGEAVVRKTIEVFRYNVEGWEALPEHEYTRAPLLVRRFREAIRLLERDGTKASPFVLVANFIDGTEAGFGWKYTFMWLDITGVVKGFYLRESDGTLLELYPVVYNTAQVPGTAWRLQGGAVVTSAEESGRLPADEQEAAVVIPSEILADRNVLVGLILADGGRTPGVKAMFYRKPRTGDLAPME